jgi:hypothetical protein
MAPRGTLSVTPRNASVRRGRNHPERNVFVTSRASMARGEAGEGMAEW